MIQAKKEKSKSHCNAPVLAGLMVDKFIESLKVVYCAAKIGVNTPLFNLVEEFDADII